MSRRFRLRVDQLEARDVPASLMYQLPDNSTAVAQFTTPDGVDPTQTLQALPVSDLTVTANGTAFVVQPGATADYEYGALVGVTAVALPPTPTDGLEIDLNIGMATVGGYAEPTTPIAPTQITFTLPDGNTGTITYGIPASVDPTLTSQSLVPTEFDVNIAGQDFAAGSATFTAQPTLLFANGELAGVSFTLDTSTASGFAYTSVAANGLNLTATTTDGSQLQTVATVTPLVPDTSSLSSTDGSQLQTVSTVVPPTVPPAVPPVTPKTAPVDVPAATMGRITTGVINARVQPPAPGGPPSTTIEISVTGGHMESGVPATETLEVGTGTAKRKVTITYTINQVDPTVNKGTSAHEIKVTATVADPGPPPGATAADAAKSPKMTAVKPIDGKDRNVTKTMFPNSWNATKITDTITKAAQAAQAGGGGTTWTPSKGDPNKGRLTATANGVDITADWELKGGKLVITHAFPTK